ncbi:MAG: ROK family protein [Pseudomonadota bacterium]
MQQPDKPILMLADIGGTNARFAICASAEMAADSQGLDHIRIYLTRDFASLDLAISAYLDDIRWAPSALALAVAAHVPTGIATGCDVVISFDNNPWSFAPVPLKKRLQLDHLVCVNDFVAQGLAHSRYFLAQDVRKAGEGQIAPCHDANPAPISTLVRGEPDEAAPMIVIGAGTGLGTAILVPEGNHFTVLAGQGGHMYFAPISDLERELARWFSAHRPEQLRHQPITAEDFASGRGLERIYAFLKNQHTSDAGKRSFSSADVIGRKAVQGDRLAREAVYMMMGILARFAANAVLLTNATGGVILAGGIMPKLAALFETSPFLDQFIDHPGFPAMLRRIPFYLAADPLAGLKGVRLAFAAGSRARTSWCLLA